MELFEKLNEIFKPAEQMPVKKPSWKNKYYCSECEKISFEDELITIQSANSEDIVCPHCLKNDSLEEIE